MLRPVATTAFPAARAALAISTPIPRPAPVINQTFFPLVGPSRRACKDVLGRRSSCLSDIPSLLSLVKLLSPNKSPDGLLRAIGQILHALDHHGNVRIRPLHQGQSSALSDDAAFVQGVVALHT